MIVCAEPSCTAFSTGTCMVCGVIRYCGTVCQRKHWLHTPYGHKRECKVYVAVRKKEAFFAANKAAVEADKAKRDGAKVGEAAVQHGGGGGGGGGGGDIPGGATAVAGNRDEPADASGGGGSDAGAASVEPLAPSSSVNGDDDGDHDACYICLGADGSVIPLGCGCRGAAGGAHLACMVKGAVHAYDQTEGLSWTECSLCRQRYTGQMQMGLAEEGVKRVQHLVETDCNWIHAQAVLAGALHDTGKYAEAEALYRKVVSLKQNVFGAEHPNTLVTIHQLALCLKAQCKYEEAIKLHRTNLRHRRRVLGLADRYTLSTKTDLAGALQCNGQIEEAETLYRTTLKTMKRELPKNDNFTLATMSGFAALLNDKLEKHAEAEEIFRELVAVQQQVLGPEHPDTLLNVGNLATSLSCQEKDDEALPIAREFYASYVKVCGPEHPDTLGAAHCVACSLVALEEYAEAETILRETLVLLRKVLGADHDRTVYTASALQDLIDDGNASIQTMPQ